MKNLLFRSLLTIIVGFFVFACDGGGIGDVDGGGIGDANGGDPALCAEMLMAGLACPYSGLTQAKALEIQSKCEQNPKGVECALNAYQNHCTSTTELLAAMQKCL